jgi:hypothetical protein
MSEEDPKAENIMNNIYIGKEATKCDGNIYGISTFMHIMTAKPKKPDDNALFIDMITADFQYKIDVDYTIQHRYRQRSISFFFFKDMIFGMSILGIICLVYFEFIETFKDYENNSDYSMGPSDGKYQNKTVEEKIEALNMWVDNW